MKVNEVLVKVYEPGRLQMAWQQVRDNAGAAGIDQMTVEEFAQREEQLLALIHDKLKSGTYRFQPARRVLIPKAGTSKKRKLGIPVVMDRIVGTSMHRVLEEIFDPQFTASNFGFRQGRSQHLAIRDLQRLVLLLLYPTLFRESLPNCSELDLYHIESFSLVELRAAITLAIRVNYAS